MLLKKTIAFTERIVVYVYSICERDRIESTLHHPYGAIWNCGLRQYSIYMHGHSDFVSRQRMPDFRLNGTQGIYICAAKIVVSCSLVPPVFQYIQWIQMVVLAHSLIMTILHISLWYVMHTIYTRQFQVESFLCYLIFVNTSNSNSVSTIKNMSKRAFWSLRQRKVESTCASAQSD